MVSRGRIHVIVSSLHVTALSSLTSVSSELQGVLSSNVAKREALEVSLASQVKKNDIINLHLQHTLASAGLSKDESTEITANIAGVVSHKNKEIDKLTLNLIKRGVSLEDIMS